MKIEQFISGDAVDCLVDILLLVGLDGAILDANDAALECYGYSRAEMLALHIRDIRAPDDTGSVEEQLRTAGECEALFETDHRRGDGSLFPVEVRSTRVGSGSDVALLSVVNEITARRQAEDARREGEERFRRMADNAPVLLWTSGADAKCDYFNQPWLDFTGRTMEQELGDGWAAGVHPDDYADVLRTYLSAFEARREFQMEYRLRCADGEFRWLLDRGVPQFSPGGEFCGYIGSCTDITVTKQAIDSLRDAHGRIERIIEGTDVGTWEWNVQTGETVFNRRWAQIAGYELEELAPVSIRTWRALAHPDDLARSEEILQRHFDGELPNYDFECRMRHKDGSWVWVHDRGRVISRTSDGEPLMMFGTHADITERRRTEEALAESERQISLIFEHIPEAILVTSVKTGRIIQANEGLFKMSGLRRDQVIGHTTDDLLLWVDDDEHAQFREQVIRDGGVRDFATSFRKATGDILTATISSTIVEIEGDPCSLVVVRDITERQRAQAALRETEQRFETVFRASPISISLSRMSDGILLDVNDAYLELFDLRRDEVIGRCAEDLAVWVNLEDRRGMLEELQAGRHVTSPYAEFRTKSGEGKRVLGVAERVDIAGEPCILGFAQDIGELMRAQDALRKSEALYRAVVETSPDGFLMVDANEQIIETNDAYCRSSGYSRDELMGMWLGDLNAELSHAESAERIASVVQGGSQIFETQHRMKNGTVWPVEVTASYWPIDGGRLFISIRDVAQRRRAEFLVQTRAMLAELEQSDGIEALMQTGIERAQLLSGSSLGFFHLVTRNEDRVDLRTWTTVALTASHAPRQTESDHPMGIAGVWGECIRSGKPMVHNRHGGIPDSRLGLPPGHEPIGSGLMVPVVRAGVTVALIGVGNKVEDYDDDDIQAVGAVASMVTDLVLRKQTQDEFEQFFELVPDLACVISGGGLFHRVNPEWERELGYSAGDLLGHSYVDFVHPEDREYTRAQFEVPLKEIRPVAGFTNRWRAHDGTYHWLEWNAAPMDHNLIFGAAHDITERKADEERLMRYQLRLRALAAELVVSGERERSRLGVELHDGLGQVLTAAKMSAQQLAASSRRGEQAEQADKLVELLSESIREVRMLTSELAPTVMFELGLGPAVLWLRDRYSQLYGLTCTVRTDADIAELRGEKATFLFRVIREALNNVVRHSGVLRATVSITTSGAWTCVTVSDRGVGFDTELIDDPGEDGGFGLFSIREECLTMDGSLDIWSKPGGGTRIQARVPSTTGLSTKGS
jgi:PAS domain S-box-containing protein